MLPIQNIFIPLINKKKFISQILVLHNNGNRNEGGSPVPPEESVPAVGEVDLDSLGPSDTLALTLPFSAPAATSPVLVGGKGCQLALLTQMKSQVCWHSLITLVLLSGCFHRFFPQEFVVPSGFCITLAAFRKQLEVNFINALQHIVEYSWS